MKQKNISKKLLGVVGTKTAPKDRRDWRQAQKSHPKADGNCRRTKSNLKLTEIVAEQNLTQKLLWIVTYQRKEKELLGL